MLVAFSSWIFPLFKRKVIEEDEETRVIVDEAGIKNAKKESFEEAAILIVVSQKERGRKNNDFTRTSKQSIKS